MAGTSLDPYRWRPLFVPWGYRMRVRSSYCNGTSGDNVNSTTRGDWKYFIFTG